MGEVAVVGHLVEEVAARGLRGLARTLLEARQVGLQESMAELGALALLVQMLGATPVPFTVGVEEEERVATQAVPAPRDLFALPIPRPTRPRWLIARVVCRSIPVAP